LKIQLIEREKVTGLREPIVISGLPGSGLVGKVAVDHIIQELSAKHFAEVYCDGMAAQIFIDHEGVAQLNRNDLFYWRNPEGKRDLIFYTGDSQPATGEAEYVLSSWMAEYLGKLAGSELVTLGAYVTGNFAAEPKVYGSATDEEYVQRLTKIGVKIMGEGAITGMNGLLLGIAKLRGYRGCSLLGETSGYAVDPKASKSVVSALSKLIDVNMDLSALDVRAKEAKSLLRNSQAGEDQPDETEQSDEARKRLGYIS
jgi:uncharacterized protein